MKQRLMIVLTILLASASYARATPPASEIVRVPLAVEYWEGKVFKQMVGRLELDRNETITIVVFIADPLDSEHAIALPHVYKIIFKSVRATNRFYVEGMDEVCGVKLSGTIDTTIETEPRIDFMLGESVQIVNISREGKAFAAKYIPKLNIGWAF